MGKPTSGTPTTTVITNAKQFATRPQVNLASGKPMPVTNAKAIAAGQIAPVSLVAMASRSGGKRGK